MTSMILQDQRKQHRQRYTSKIVTLKVGSPVPEDLSVHEDVLRQSSPFFAAALDKKWIEGQKGEISLPEDELDVVVAYLHWVYRGEISSVHYQAYCLYAKLYAFGEKVQNDLFCDDVLVAMLRSMDMKGENNTQWFPGPPAIRIIYAATPEGSLMRKMLVQMYVQHSAAKWMDRRSTEYPLDFLFDLTKELVTLKTQTNQGTMYEQRSKWMKSEQKNEAAPGTVVDEERGQSKKKNASG